jgi:hypothetical protein
MEVLALKRSTLSRRGKEKNGTLGREKPTFLFLNDKAGWV